MATTITLPSIDITFRQLASTFIARSERGVVLLLIKDDTDKTFNCKTYTNQSALEADNGIYTADNYKHIADALTFAVNKIIVVRVDTTETTTDALALVPDIANTGWITMVGEAADYTTINAWVKAKRASGYTYKAVVYNATAPDCTGIVNFVNPAVTFADARGTQTGEKYLPSLAGILASCNVDRGTTYFVCSNLAKVEEVADINAALNAGKFALINDTGKVKIGLGINSLTTFTATNTEDMRYIDIIEAMDLIKDDVRDAFKTDFVGRYKNNTDNQVIFVSAVNTYLKELAKTEVLDSEYKNYADIDINAQRKAWTAIKPEAETWDDAKVRNTTYKRNVYLAGDIKILGSMENLKFVITMS